MEKATGKAFAVPGSSAREMTVISKRVTQQEQKPMRNEYEDSVSPAVAEHTTSGDAADAVAGQTPGRTIADDRREQAEKPDATRPAVVEEVLIEEVSIDGMCGVY